MRRARKSAKARRKGDAPSLSSDDVELMLQAEKYLDEDLRWAPVPDTRRLTWMLDAEVSIHDSVERLRLIARWNKRKWGYALIMRGVPIRRFDKHPGGHRNHDGVLIKGPHKHTWSEEHGCGDAYVPNDIDFADVHQGLSDFLKECGIIHRGTIQPFSLMEG